MKDDLHVVDVEGERRSDERGLCVEGGGGGGDGRGGRRGGDGRREPHAAALRHHEPVERRDALRVRVRRRQDVQALRNYKFIHSVLFLSIFSYSWKETIESQIC